MPVTTGVNNGPGRRIVIGPTRNPNGSVSTITGLPWVTVGPPGSNYPITAYGNSFGAALNAAITAAGTTNFPAFAIQIGPGTWIIDQQIVLQSAGQVIIGCGPQVTILEPAAGLNVDAISGLGNLNWADAQIGNFKFDGTNLTAVAAPTAVAMTGSPFTYVHGTTGATPATGPAYVVLASSGVTWTTGVTNCAITLAGGSAKSLGTTSARIAALLASGSGIYMNIGDTLLLTWSAGTPTMAYQYTNGYLNLTTLAYRTGAESSAYVNVHDIALNANMNAGSQPYNSVVMDGCEDAVAYNVNSLSSGGGIQYQTYNGIGRVLGGKFTTMYVCGVTFGILGTTVGNGGLIYGYNGGIGVQDLDLVDVFFNGSTGSTGTIQMLNTATQLTTINVFGGWLYGGAVGNSAAGFITGAGLAYSYFNFYGVECQLGSLTAHYPLFSAAPGSFYGSAILSTNASLTNADFIGVTQSVPITNGQFSINRAGVITQYVNTTPLVGSNLGGPGVVATTGSASVALQTTSTAILSFTPSVTGLYRVMVNMTHVSASIAGTLTIGYTEPAGGSNAAETQSYTIAAAGAGVSVSQPFICNAKAAVALTVNGTSATNNDIIATATIEEM